ncbi:MAG: hypothetical protein JST38_09120 [Bacteroidetes bacterium]|nr:hypothetical protein [Bacteroidota bacterium]MBS1941023.1 hypothetical protein [Bacteroidota bacterium]
MKLISTLLLAVAFPWAGIAQDHCLSHTLTERWLQQHGKHVDLAQEAALLESQGIRGGGTLTIPVVVHVVWNTAAENVPDLVITNILDQMNDDYQALNSDYGNVRPVFAPLRANANIDFCLATVAPDGSATTGIVRQQTTKTWFDPDSETDDMKYPPYGSSAWNTNKYLNIWICDISSGASGGLVTAGYAYLPYGGMVGSPIDGLVLDRSYGTGLGDRTATHEVGHYLGLDHPWGDGNCSPGDGISDTPATNSPTYSCSNTSLMKCNTLTQYENFMDYSNCTMMFTNGQAAVMTGVLNGVRSQLLTSNACQGGGGSTLCIPTSAQGTSGGDFVDGVVLGSINHTGTGSTEGPTYNDYTAFSTNLDRNNSYTVQVTSGEYEQDLVAAWIDFNQNGNLEASELLGNATTSAPFEVSSFTFTVPGNAVPGNTVLRARVVYPADGEPLDPDPCANYTWGETEDYGIVINSPASIDAAQGRSMQLSTFQDHVLLEWGFTAKERHAMVVDASGRSLESFVPDASQADIPTGHLAPGVYQLILNLDGSRFTSRFFVAGK